VHAIREGKKKHQDYNQKNKQEKWQINGYLLLGFKQGNYLHA
jgi:hypothetical protein